MTSSTDTEPFKPSDVHVFVDCAVPFVQTFGKAEAEILAAVLVLACRDLGDEWAPVPTTAALAVMKRHKFAGILLAMPGMLGNAIGALEGGGWITASEDRKSVAFTPLGLERLRRWVGAR